MTIFADLERSKMMWQPSQSISMELIDRLMLDQLIGWPNAYNLIDPYKYFFRLPKLLFYSTGNSKYLEIKT